MWSAPATSESGAGGFLDTTYYGDDNAAQPQKSEKLKAGAIAPLMIKQLDPSLLPRTLCGKDVSLVSIVGYVRKIERVTTKISYELFDESGSIMAYQWLSEDKKKEPTIIAVGKLARAIGTPREHGGKPHLLILKIAPVKKLTDYFGHLVKVMFVRLKDQEVIQQGDNLPGNNVTTMENDCADYCHGMNEHQVHVFKAIKAHNDTDTGIEKSVLKATLPNDIKPKFDDILEFLMSEGHIYTTCTDDHFKAT